MPFRPAHAIIKPSFICVHGDDRQARTSPKDGKDCRQPAMQSGVFGNWDNPQIVFLADNQVVLDSEVVDRLSRRGWKVALHTSSIFKAFRAIYENKASILIIGDSAALPAILCLRNVVSDPILILTPTVVICTNSHAADKSHMKELGHPEIIDAPINPASFIESFEWLLRRWSQGPLQQLRLTRRLLLEKKISEAVKTLSHLMTETEIIPLAVPCLAHFIRRQSDARAVEKILLNALKEHPRNLGIILVMVDFYIKAAMPDTALKIIAAARKNHGNPQVIIPEQVQALVMLNRISEVIPLLESMKATKFMPESAHSFLQRCFYAEGYLEKFKKYFENQDVLIEEFQKSWSKNQLNQSA